MKIGIRVNGYTCFGVRFTCFCIISLARSCISNFFRDWAPFLDKDFSFLQSDREIYWHIMLFNKIYILFINFIVIFIWASVSMDISITWLEVVLYVALKRQLLTVLPGKTNVKEHFFIQHHFFHIHVCLCICTIIITSFGKSVKTKVRAGIRSECHGQNANVWNATGFGGWGFRVVASIFCIGVLGNGILSLAFCPEIVRARFTRKTLVL